MENLEIMKITIHKYLRKFLYVNSNSKFKFIKPFGKSILQVWQNSVFLLVSG
jgi:hypothetical protein